VEIIENLVGHTNGYMPAVLGNRALSSIITQAHDEIAATSPSNLKQLAMVPCSK
jgi:hypothetical protein